MNRLIKIRKKGMLFALGFTFLTLCLLTLAVLIFHSAQKSEEIVSKLAAVDRVYDLDVSLQQSLREVFNLKSGISIDITESGVSFEEKLPNPNAAAFNSSMTIFKNFVDSNFSNINITTTGINTQLPLIIMPKDITYRHLNFGNRKIQVTPQQINFNGYAVFMSINKNISSCNKNSVDGSFNFSVEVVDPDNDDCSYSLSIDPSADNEVLVNGGAVTVSVAANILTIQISDGSGISADVRTTMQLGSATSAYVTYASPAIQIWFDELGIYKESNVNLR